MLWVWGLLHFVVVVALVLVLVLVLVVLVGLVYSWMVLMGHCCWRMKRGLFGCWWLWEWISFCRLRALDPVRGRLCRGPGVLALSFLGDVSFWAVGYSWVE